MGGNDMVAEARGDVEGGTDKAGSDNNVFGVR